VHRKYIPIYIQQDATLHILFISGNCSTCFGWYFRPSSGAHTTVSTASGICHTVTAICLYRGRDGTGLSVLWVGSITFFNLKIRVDYEKISKNIVESGRPQMTTWRMRILRWIPKATDRNSEYVIPIAFPLQQWFHERTSMLRYTYIACLVIFITLHFEKTNKE
jgi:hypothetical protein